MLLKKKVAPERNYLYAKTTHNLTAQKTIEFVSTLFRFIKEE
jgi:hypothetical protein